MIERLLLLMAFTALVLLIMTVLRRRRQQVLAAAEAAGLPDEWRNPGTAQVLAFSLPGCRDCKTRQAPVLNRLSALPGVTIRSVPADAHPDLVDRFGIMTVPATLVVGADGRVRALNQGFADLPTLQRQLGLAE
jgi:hypothetical protein